MRTSPKSSALLALSLHISRKGWRISHLFDANVQTNNPKFSSILPEVVFWYVSRLKFVLQSYGAKNVSETLTVTMIEWAVIWTGTM